LALQMVVSFVCREFAGHAVQAVVASVPVYPAAQDSHAVEAPSMKYWPAPQHTAWPVGVQCTVPEGQETEVGQVMNGDRTLPLLYMVWMEVADSTVL
jgi:hypothetical protein